MASHEDRKGGEANTLVTDATRPRDADRNPSTRFRIKFWASAGIIFLILAVAIRLGWEYTDGFTIERFFTITLSIACVLGIGALLIAMVLEPRRLRSPIFFITVAVIVSLGMIGGLIHYVRFVFISDVPALAIIIATALTLASMCGFILILYSIRWARQHYPDTQASSKDADRGNSPV